MLQYLTRNFGDRAANGDRSLLRQFYDEIDELTLKLVKLNNNNMIGRTKNAENRKVITH